MRPERGKGQRNGHESQPHAAKKATRLQVRALEQLAERLQVDLSASVRENLAWTALLITDLTVPQASHLIDQWRRNGQS